MLDFLGARSTGTDLYLNATKLFLAQGLLLNATLRNTNANQNGLLGFGSATPGAEPAQLAARIFDGASAAPGPPIGAEYRRMPNNLEALGRSAGLGDALHADSWKDIFIAWAPGKNLSVTLAYLQLGRIGPGVTADRRQSGAYLSAQAAF